MANKKEQKENKTLEEESEETPESRGYELGYLVISSVSDEELSGEVENIKDALNQVGVSIHSEKAPKKIDLAYPMVRRIKGDKKSFDSAFFGWVKFEAYPTGIAELQEILDEDENILRYMVIRVSNESLVSSKSSESSARPTGPTPERPKRQSSDRQTGGGDVREEIDKTIDELVEGQDDMVDNKATSNT